MTFNGSDRKAVRRAEKAAGLAERNRIAYVKHIMSEPFGRAWMLQLLTKCHIFHTSFVRGAPDATVFALGEQNIGLAIFSDVATYCPNEYTLMMQEQALKEDADARRNIDDIDGTAASTGTEQDSGRDDRGPVDEDDTDNGYIGESYLDDAGIVHWPKRR